MGTESGQDLSLVVVLHPHHATFILVGCIGQYPTVCPIFTLQDAVLDCTSGFSEGGLLHLPSNVLSRHCHQLPVAGDGKLLLPALCTLWISSSHQGASVLPQHPGISHLLTSQQFWGPLTSRFLTTVFQMVPKKPAGVVTVVDKSLTCSPLLLVPVGWVLQL